MLMPLRVVRFHHTFSFHTAKFLGCWIIFVVVRLSRYFLLARQEKQANIAAQQESQTDPHAALQMLLETRSLEPRYWTARHQEWLAYLESVCKAP